MTNCCGSNEVCETKKVEASLCPADQTKGKPVATRTLWYLVKGKFQKDVKKEGAYFFCPSPDCEVVYFSQDSGPLFTKDKIRVAVGQKERVNPQVCYCFNFFESDLREEIEASSKTTIPEFIRQKVKEEACACEIMNPQGTCCLGNVLQAVKRVERKQSKGGQTMFEGLLTHGPPVFKGNGLVSKFQLTRKKGEKI